MLYKSGKCSKNRENAVKLGKMLQKSENVVKIRKCSKTSKTTELPKSSFMNPHNSGKKPALHPCLLSHAVSAARPSRQSPVRLEIVYALNHLVPKFAKSSKKRLGYLPRILPRLPLWFLLPATQPRQVPVESAPGRWFPLSRRRKSMLPRMEL